MIFFFEQHHCSETSFESSSILLGKALSGNISPLGKDLGKVLGKVLGKTLGKWKFGVGSMFSFLFGYRKSLGCKDFLVQAKDNRNGSDSGGAKRDKRGEYGKNEIGLVG